VVRVTKTRVRFRIDECQAEFTSVTFSQVTHETVAIESIEPHRVLPLVRELRLDLMPNMSCVRALKQILCSNTNLSARV